MKYDAQRAKVKVPQVGIRAVRRASGMSLAALATAITDLGYPVSASQLNNVELGHRGASAELLKAWASALDLDPGEIDAVTTRRTRRASA